MSSIEISYHVIQRLSQRVLTSTDAELIMELGSEVEGGFLVRHKDVLAIEYELKALLSRVKRLRGKRLVIGGDGKVITAYHAQRQKQRDLLRT